MPDEPKLIIDSDWKSQAQAEKERLAEKSAPKPASKPAAAAAADPAAAPKGEHDGEHEGPIGFKDLVGMLATQAMQFMGYFPDPQTGQAMVSLEYARLHIDMLGILEEKTKGNLSDAENAFLSKTAAQLRLEFVEVQKMIAKAVQEGKIKAVNPSGLHTGSAGGGIAGPGLVQP